MCVAVENGLFAFETMSTHNDMAKVHIQVIIIFCIYNKLSRTITMPLAI